MKPVEARRILLSLWWLQLLIALLPVWFFPRNIYNFGQNDEWVSLMFFIVALSVLFLNIKPFSRFKHAVIAVGQARGTNQESAAWQGLMHARLRALWMACLPAWAAALAKILGLEMPAVVLLTVASPALFWLYRTPKQLS